ncbi:MAG: hypothetical protein KJ795_07045 [Gammaproteobacteria bacterium]|nr:hypothetical protein [Gammaproteobacteria bacterium]MBU1775289.1 hypothetical protein [Gammaproteobacteria bacterium]MBU1969740.1 hypothetical protein [Gammaproteobacteria bacterium]
MTYIFLCVQYPKRWVFQFGYWFITGVMLVFATAHMSTTARADEMDLTLQADLQRIAQQKIFFGHQSVGRNLLEGIEQLSAKAGVSVRVIEVPTAGSLGQAGIGHTAVAKNGDPFQKLKSFEQALGQQATGPDIALVKFCYVDFTPNVDTKALFESYRTTINTLQAKNPSTIFVHVTAPLTVIQGGFKGTIKRLLGKAPYGFKENVRREEYNARLRQAYLGREPIFDLARIESTDQNGNTVTSEWQGIEAPAMAPAYTDDGGHLNSTGKLRAARELISVLARIPGRRSTGTQSR